MVVLTIAILVLFAVILVVAAFFDRRRGRQIAHDPDRAPRRSQRASGDDEH